MAASTPPGFKPANVAGSRPSCNACGLTLARIDCPDMRICKAVRFLSASNPPVSLHWVIAVVRHILFARPQELDGRARHLHRDPHGLADVVDLPGAAAAETAAEEGLVNVALGNRQSARL